MTNRSVVGAFGVTSALVILMAGCSKEPVPRSVDWYRAHPGELVTQVEACKNDPGGVGKTRNCTNAKRAAFLDDSHAQAAPLTPIKTK